MTLAAPVLWGLLLGLAAAAALVVWVLPRLTASAAWIAVVGLAAVAVAAALFGVGPLALVPAVALLFGQLGRATAASAAREMLPAGVARTDAQTPPSRLPMAPAPAAPLEPGQACAPVPPTLPSSKPLPATLGRYRLDAQIGRGAMGAVFLGHDPQIGRQVALKTLALSREFQGDKLAEARRRFFREAESAGRLQHPDIVGIFDAGEAQDLAYIAMEYIKGQDLQRHAAPGRLLPVPQVLELAARVADALAYAHRQGVVHRDIKPANVMVNLETGLVKVTDFGIARIADAARTRTGLVLGTPSYMSPEQMAGRRIDGRTDLYSLGVMLFQLLTGALPHLGDSMAKLMYQIANDPAPDIRSLRPELPQALAEVVALALQKRAEVRYADGRQLAVDLRAIAAQPGELPAPAPAEPQARSHSESDEFEKTVTFARLDPRHNSAP